MKSWFMQLLRPPVFEDAEKTRTAVTLHILTFTVSFLGVVHAIFSISLLKNTADLVFICALVLFTFSLNVLSHCGFPKTAAWLLSLGLGVVLSIWLFSRTRDNLYIPALHLQLVPIFVASFLISTRLGLFAATFASSVGFIGLLISSQYEALRFDEDILTWASHGVFFYGSAIFLGRISDHLNKALYKLSLNEQQLAQQNKMLHTEVEERGQTAEVLRANIEIDRMFGDRLKKLNIVSIELSNEESFEEVCRLAVELGRSELGFDRLGIWLIDEQDSSLMLGSYGTDEHGRLRDERAERRPISPPVFGKDLISGQKSYLYWEDIGLRNDKGEVVGQGWSAAAALRDGKRVIGWINTDNLLTKNPLRQQDLELLMLYGSTIGHLIVQKRTVEALRTNQKTAHRFQESLKALHEIGIELTALNSLDLLYRQAVELGRGRLGFDRLGVLLIDEERQVIVGTYGTNAQGEVQDMSQMEFPITAQSKIVKAIKEQMRVSFVEHAPLYDALDVMGHGWHAMSLLWDGSRCLGWLSADNLLDKKPIEPYQLELLTLYSAMLAQLHVRIKAQEALILSEARFSKAFSTNPSAIAITGLKDGRYLDVNESWCKLTGYSREEALGQTALGLNVYANPEDRHYLLNTIHDKGSYRDVEIMMRAKDNTLRHLLMHGEVIELDGEQYWLSMLNDITERKQIETQRLELALTQERIELLTEFLGNISHDLKTPLSVINNSLYLLERINDPERQKDKVNIIKQQTRLLEKYIQDILTISRLEHSPQLERKPVDLNQLLRDILHRLLPSAERKHLQTTLDLAASLPIIIGSERELDRVLVNLVENAVNYTPHTGSICLRTQAQASSAVIEIIDTGIGISSNDLPRIFERFYRADKARSTEEGGTGLGLAIVKKIIDLHGGSIEVESQPGKGSTFRVRLPLDQTAIQRAAGGEKSS